jgi:hypothetical protein
LRRMFANCLTVGAWKIVVRGNAFLKAFSTGLTQLSQAWTLLRRAVYQKTRQNA